MKEFNTIVELVEFVNLENGDYRSGDFETYKELESEAKEHFNSITEEYEEREDYYAELGLEIGDCFIKSDKSSEDYYIVENDTTATVNFYEAYLDSGVPAEDYFYGFYITQK